MADPRERYGDWHELLRLSFDAHQAALHTAMPGIVQSYDPAAQTVTVQPAIKARVTLSSGDVVQRALPLLVDVPAQFPGGGGHCMTFPVQPGDEVLVVFGSRCMDGWWKNGGVQPQLEHRMHDLSDGFALLGFRSQVRTIPNVSAATTQLRSDDGKTLVDVDGAGQVLTLKASGTVVKLNGQLGIVGISAPNGMVVDAPTLACTGEIIRGYGTGDQVTLGGHLHQGASAGKPPQPGT